MEQAAAINKDEKLSEYEKVVLQTFFGDVRFNSAFDHFLYIERKNWERRALSIALAGTDATDPVGRLMQINEAAAKATVYERFFATLNARSQVAAPTGEKG